MIAGQQPYASRASSRQGLVAGEKWTWVTDLLFWLFFVVDVFAVCYWLTSRLAALLMRAGILPLNTATVVVLLVSALLTPVVVRGIILLVKRRR